MSNIEENEIIINSELLNNDFDDFVLPRRETMKADIYEKDGNYNIELDMPGFKKEDIKIEVKEGYIIISAEKKEEKEEKDENVNYLCNERRYGKITRSFNLGDLDEKNIKAKFENGTLSMVAPKKVAVESNKLIEIE